jgi:hypothetical protein
MNFEMNFEMRQEMSNLKIELIKIEVNCFEITI